jgi:hypothetical protein
MKLSHRVIASLICVALCFEAGAAESLKTGGASRAVADLGSAAGNAAPSRDASTKADRVADSESPRALAPLGGALKSGHPAAAVAPRRSSVAQPRGVGEAARIRADPQHVLLNAQARGRLAPRSAGASGTGAVGQGIRGAFGARPVGQRPLAASMRATVPAMTPTATARDSTIGGPRVQALGRIGGPVYSRASHGATIDGTQLHHKF